MEEQNELVSPIEETVDAAAAVAVPETITPAAESGEGLRVVFNRTQRLLNPEEAVRYAQQGLKWEQFAPHYRKLRFLGEKLGSGVGEVVDGLLSCWEQEEWEALSAAHPDEPHKAAQLFADARRQREQTWGEAPVAPSEEERLAGEYAALCEEVPDAPAFSALPPEMWQVAEKERISLLDAYLRVRFREQRRVQEARASAASAAARSAGSMRGEPHEPDTTGEAFLRALTRAV
ncbi:MAG: hypothetical protein J6K98_02980 [Clostridia bacterium]|nr:hypothetical protein [Clostridia bacterium]